MKRAKATTTEEREQKFIENLLLGLGKRDAAIAAGYSPRTAHQIAYELLDRPSVKTQLQGFYKRDEAEVLITRELVRQKLFRAAMANAHEAFDNDWELRRKNEVPEDCLELIVSVRTWSSPEMGSGCSAKLVNPLDAQKSYLKLFPAPISQADSLQGAAEEVEQEVLALIARFDEDDEEDFEEDDAA